VFDSPDLSFGFEGKTFQIMMSAKMREQRDCKECGINHPFVDVLLIKHNPGIKTGI
jgi:hypothetical protein